jgi:DNA-binding protein H-NS
MAEKTYRQLTAELSELDRKINEARQEERKAVLQRLRELMNSWDISPSELGPYKRGSYHTKPVKKMYRDPDTGREWSGRGRTPAWIEGKDRTRFLIEDDRRSEARSSNRSDTVSQQASRSTAF